VEKFRIKFRRSVNVALSETLHQYYTFEFEYLIISFSFQFLIALELTSLTFQLNVLSLRYTKCKISRIVD